MSNRQGRWSYVKFFNDVCTDSNLVQNEAKEEDCPSPNDQQLPQEGEPDFYETKCHWKDCTSEFDTQEDLVKVSDVDQLFLHCDWLMNLNL